jgi:hypothetical protein
VPPDGQCSIAHQRALIHTVTQVSASLHIDKCNHQQTCNKVLCCTHWNGGSYWNIGCRPGQPGAGRYLGACRRACMAYRLYRRSIALVKVRVRHPSSAAKTRCRKPWPEGRVGRVPPCPTTPWASVVLEHISPSCDTASDFWMRQLAAGADWVRCRLAFSPHEL